MDFLTLLLLALLLAGAILLAALLTPPIYAWADRWLDRTHQSTAGEEK